MKEVHNNNNKIKNFIKKWLINYDAFMKNLFSAPVSN